MGSGKMAPGAGILPILRAPCCCEISKEFMGIFKAQEEQSMKIENSFLIDSKMILFHEFVYRPRHSASTA